MFQFAVETVTSVNSFIRSTKYFDSIFFMYLPRSLMNDISIADFDPLKNRIISKPA